MAATTVGLVQGQPAYRMGHETEGTALKTVHFQPMEKDTAPAVAVAKPPERFLPPIEDKKSAKEGNSKVDIVKVHSFAECVPPELLLSLKRQNAPAGGGGGTRRSPKGTLQPVATVRPTPLHPPANAWNHSKQRSKFKHLTDSAPCVCGAGRDISFLYDVTKQQQESNTLRDDQTTLIPAEFHIVQHPGVHGTEFKDDQYTTRLEEHQTHITTFPSLNPSSRREVLALKQAYEGMLEKAGVGGVSPDRQPQSGPTQLHRMLELVKEEQNIFNIVFHEIIRQVSVHCVEQGDLLAQLRKRYSDLLSKVPKEMKSLHDELLAQRALDRRLTEELTTFKDQVELVTKELSDVKDHDFHLTVQIGEDKTLLLEALESSQKNTSILQEYHDLYELQRKRLEYRIGDLKREKDLWQQAAYKLANKITDSQDLQTVRRQQVCERSWHCLAQHFAILLNDRDTEQLLAVQEHVLTWREALVEFTESQESLESQLNAELQDIKGSLEEWSGTLGDHYGGKDSGNAEPLSSLEFQTLTEDIQRWDSSLNKHYAKFAGDILLRRQEKLQRLSEEVEAWTDEAVGIFHRHCTAHNDSLQLPEHVMMTKLNTQVCQYHQELGERVAGEDGVASGLMHVSTPLETWSNKLSLAAQSKDNRISESDWIKLRSDLKSWAGQLSGVVRTITADKDGSKSGLSELLSSADKWIKALANVINGKNAQIMDEANSLHTSLTQWTVEFLLFLTCIEADEEFELMLGGMAERQTQTGLRSTSQHIVGRLKEFTTKLLKCCGDVAHEIAARERNQSLGDQEGESSGSEVKDLKQMEVECQEWVRTVDLLLKEALESPLDSQRMSSCKRKGAGTEEEGVANSLNDSSQARSEASSTAGGPLEGGVAGEEEDEVFVLGVDSNVYRKSLMDLEKTSNDEEFAGSSAVALGLPTVNDIPFLPADALPKPEELIVELDTLEKKLKVTEEAAQSAESRAVRAEQELAAALQRVSLMEKELEDSQELHKELAAQRVAKSSAKQKKGTRGSTTQLLNAKKKESKLATKT